MRTSKHKPGRSGSSATRRKRWAYRLGASAFTIVFVGLLLEGGARVLRALGPTWCHTERYGYPSDLFVWHETREYGLRPGFSGFFAGARYADIPIEINPDGYRDAPFERAKSAAVKRVVFLGNSVTFGSGVRAESRFSNLLARSAAETEYESLNLGVNAYTSYHYLQQLREDVPKYDPDVVVIAFCLNDLAPKELSWPRNLVYLRNGTRLGTGPVPARWRTRAKELSAFVALLVQLRNRMRKQASDEEAWQRWYRSVITAWQDEQLVDNLRRDLAQARDEMREQGRRMLVLALPEKHDLRDPDKFGNPRQRLLSLLNELEIECLDLYPVFQEQPSISELFLASDSIHFTPRGHELAADAIADRLAR